MKKIELKCCPFCGAKPEPHGETSSFFIEHDAECFIAHWTVFLDTEKSKLKWSRRAGRAPSARGGGMKYCDMLPRLHRPGLERQRCQILMQDGRRCTNDAFAEVYGFLDPETYKHEASWPIFYVCKKHFDINWELKK